MKTALFLVPLVWQDTGQIGPNGQPTRTLPIWASCHVGNEPGSGGSLPYIETPPDTIATVVYCPDSRWSIVSNNPDWQLLHEYDNAQLGSLLFAPTAICSIAGVRSMNRRQFAAAIGLLAVSSAFAKADKPLTTSHKTKIEKWIKDRKEKTWTDEKIAKAMNSKADTTRKIAKQIVSELLKWPVQTQLNCRLLA